METLNITLWKEMNTALHNFVYKKVKDRDVANDIVQDVFLKVQAKIGQLREPEKIIGWIYQIARHTITDHFRSQTKQLPVEELSGDNDSQEFNHCVADCLKKLVVTLPEKYRQAIELAELESLSQTEFANKLGISYSGAKSRVQRARKMLRDRMDALFTIETDAYGNILVCEDKAANTCDCVQAYQQVAAQQTCAATC